MAGAGPSALPARPRHCPNVPCMRASLSRDSAQGVDGHSRGPLRVLAEHAVPTQPASAYRPDIDGLRAIAVVAVVLFHAGIPGFTGGYVGVDVFYVISGYLITQLLAGSTDRRPRLR